MAWRTCRQTTAGLPPGSQMMGLIANAGIAKSATIEDTAVEDSHPYEAFAIVLGARGIRVNAVAPGVVGTDMSQRRVAHRSCGCALQG